MFNRSDYMNPNLVIGGGGNYGFIPPGYTGGMKIKEPQFEGVNTSMDEDGEIRPS
jgi:hypothetical protein